MAIQTVSALVQGNQSSLPGRVLQASPAGLRPHAFITPGQADRMLPVTNAYSSSQ
jgi:hypothetical protein